MAPPPPPPEGLEDNSSSTGNGVQITSFSQVVDDVTLHFQIIRLQKQLYAWIGCNSAKFGHLYAAAPTRPSNTVSVTSLIGGSSDNTGSSIARRVVLKTGLNVVLACNIPKNSPMLELLRKNWCKSLSTWVIQHLDLEYHLQHNRAEVDIASIYLEETVYQMAVAL